MQSFSPRMYRDFVVEIDRRIAGQFDRVIMETHSGAAHILPVLVEEPELDAIAVALDPPPAGPSLAEMLPSFEMVQQAGKSLFVHAEIKQSELDAMLEALSPVGLAIHASLLPD